MATRTLESPPSILPLYARAAAPMIPGASLLPFVPGRGSKIPEIELKLDGVRPDSEKVAAYARVCGFALRDHLPPTYPHVLAFPLHMAVMADGGFPFGAVGLVHVENRIIQRRRVGIGEELAIRVRPTALESHPKGRTFSLVTEVSTNGETVWESTSTMLRRGKASPDKVTSNHQAHHARGEIAPNGDADGVTLQGGGAEWKLGGDLGRRYAAVSGDRNPIHMHSLSAKAFGFPRAIAHGMWTKARCMAALESTLPDAFGVEVRFRKPILLPAKVAFASATNDEGTDFAVRDAKRDTPHLEGHIEPLEDQAKDDGRK
jgi:hypothetical protein